MPLAVGPGYGWQGDRDDRYRPRTVTLGPLGVIWLFVRGMPGADGTPRRSAQVLAIIWLAFLADLVLWLPAHPVAVPWLVVVPVAVSLVLAVLGIASDRSRANSARQTEAWTKASAAAVGETPIDNLTASLIVRSGSKRRLRRASS